MYKLASRPLVHLRTLTMATRRSSRLSAISNSDLVASPAQPNGAKETSKAPASRKRKAPEGNSQVKVTKKEKVAPTEMSSTNDGFAVPSTPKRKRATENVVAPPITPTPAAVKLMGDSSRSENNGAHRPPLNRLVDPLRTNAPLISPQTSRVIMTETAESMSPSKPAALQSKITTGNVLDKAISHLVEIDPRLKAIIDKHHCSVFSPEGLAEEIDPFNSLVSGIISQQVSGAAAKSIKAKFVALFNTDDAGTNGFPSPSQVAVKDIETLRTAGLSQRKAEYVKGLAEKFASGELSTEMLMKADYEEVLEKLIAVRGLGKWSVEMFACFGLKRMDVFSTGDLGVQRGMAAFMGRDVSKLKSKGGGKWKYMSENEMLEISAKFAPYRSLFMWLMWRVEDVDISTFDN